MSPSRPVHYSPKANASGPSWKRVSVCGVPTQTGMDHELGLATSNTRYVTCSKCRRVAGLARRAS